MRLASFDRLLSPATIGQLSSHEEFTTSSNRLVVNLMILGRQECDSRPCSVRNLRHGVIDPFSRLTRLFQNEISVDGSEFDQQGTDLVTLSPPSVVHLFR